MSDTPPIVHLYLFDGLALILKFPSGVHYSNQVAGLGCLHPEIEGVLIPLPVGIGRPELTALESYFGGGSNHLTEGDAAALDKIFRQTNLSFLRVDRSQLENSFEAWVHVEITAVMEDREMDLFQGFSTRAGVLTWQNSD